MAKRFTCVSFGVLCLVATAPVGASPRIAVDAGATAAPNAASLAFSFNNVPEGELPDGWTVDATNPRGPLASWTIVSDPHAPNPPHVLSLTGVKDTSRGVFNLCWKPGAEFRDGEIQVTLRANGGEVDQGGGPIWRARDRNNYYIARWNPLEDNFRLYYVKEGRRVELASEDVQLPREEWHTITVRHLGNSIVCFLDGEELLKAEDTTFPEAGGVGLWTKADAATSFDDFTTRRQD